MNLKCPDCDSDSWKVGVSQSGAQCYKCKTCGKKFNTRTATPFHWLHSPNKAVMMAAMLHVRYGLSSYKVAEMLKFNGVKVSARSIRRWPERFSSLMEEIPKRYGIKLSRATPPKQKRGGAEWNHKVALLDSEGNIVVSYFATERSAKKIERTLTREERLV